MRIRIRQTNPARADQRAFSLIEVAFGMALAGMMMTVLYTGLTYGFTVMKLARENTRATQVLIERMETIRLYTWDQLNTPGFLPTSFQVPYYPMGGTSNPGTIYNGTITLGDTSLGTSYASEMKKITVTLNWVTGSMPRTRTLSTYVAHYGLQGYIY